MNVSGGATPEKPLVVIDGGNRTCVALLIDLRYHIAGLRPGTVVHLVATDPAAPIDLPTWCYPTGHTYLGPGEGPAGRPTYALRVSARDRRTGPGSPGVWPHSGLRHHRADVNAARYRSRCPVLVLYLLLARCSRWAGADDPGRGGRGLRYDDDQPPRIPDQAGPDGAGQPVT